MRRRRKVGQLGFSDIPVTRRGNGSNDALSQIDRLVDWAAVERLLSGVHSSSRGEPAYPPLVMFKVLLLQRWHALSDPAMEAALSDRLSFMRFAGLSLSDETPDHSTIWRFRQKLIDLAQRIAGAIAAPRHRDVLKPKLSNLPATTHENLLDCAFTQNQNPPTRAKVSRMRLFGLNRQCSSER